MSDLVRFDEMKRAIVACYEVDEVANIRNQAEVYRYALRQAKESPEIIRKAEEIKLRAERRAGELLRETEFQHGSRGIGKKVESQPVTSLSEQGITKTQSSKWQKIASIPEEEFEVYLSSQKELTTTGALRLAVNVNDGTGIRWTDETWNPWYGCVKISPGCKNCYMYRDRERYRDDPSVVTCAQELTFNSPIKWKEPRKVFTCSWSDFFIVEADDWADSSSNLSDFDQEAGEYQQQVAL